MKKLTHKDFTKPCTGCEGRGKKKIPEMLVKQTLWRYVTCSTCQGSRYAPVVELIKVEGVPEGYEFGEIFNSEMLNQNFAIFRHKKLISYSKALPYPQSKIETHACEACDGVGQKECSGEFCVWEPICRLSKCKAFIVCPSCNGDHTIKTKLDIKVIKQDGEHYFEVRRVRV